MEVNIHEQAAIFSQILFDQGLSKGNQTKLKIVEATIKTIAESGVFKLTFEKIGKQIGLNRGQVKYHFPELEKLMVCALKLITFTAQQSTKDFLDAAPAEIGKLDSYISANLHWIKNFPTHAKSLVLIFHLASYHPELRKLHAKIRLEGQKRIEQMLVENENIQEKKARDISIEIQGIITGILLEHLTTDHLDQEQTEAMLKKAIHKML